MGSPTKQNLTIYQGSTFNNPFRWESNRKIYKAITNITKAAPCIVTAVGHGVPDGWRVLISDVGGMKEINSEEYYIATLKTVDTIELNDVNSVSYTAYTTNTGILEYAEPKDLAGYTARMQIRASVDSATVLLELTTVNNGILIDNVLKTITVFIDATATAALTWTSGVYSLEMVSGTGVVTTLVYGNVTVKKEITR